MWDPAYNDTSAQRSPELTKTHTAAADRHTTPHPFGAKHTNSSNSSTGQQESLAADVQLVRYSDMPYQESWHSLPSNQVQTLGPTTTDHDMLPPPEPEEDIMPLPLLPPPPSKKTFALGSSAALPLMASAATTNVTPIPHHHDTSNNNTTNNIPMEANTFDKPVNPSASPGSFSDPIPVESDVYHTVASDQTSTFSPSPSAPPPRPPPRESALEQFYSQDQHSTPSPTPAPGPSLGPAQSPSTLPRKRNTADDDNSPCIARLSIPQSHMSLFHDALTSPPDPDLKIRKKTVRFNKSSLTSSPPRSEQRNERSRESESPGPYPTSTKSPSHSSSSSSKSVAVKSGHSGSSGTMKSNVVHVVEKDPEERMAELMELKQMKIRQDDLLHLKDQVFQTGQNLEEKQSILDEVRAERKALHSELNRYITMVKQVQKDLELAIQAETQLTKERDQLSQYLNQIRDYDFKVLKEEVDQLRSKKGLRPLPSLEQEQEEFMGRYLEERRGQWREDGGGGGGSHQDPSGQPSSSSSSSAFNSSTSATAATTASSSSDTPSRGHHGSSSRTNSSGPTASSSSSSLRGRDNNTDSRLNRTSGSHSNHSRNNSSASAGRHSSRGTTSQSSSSRSRRQSRSRSRSPAPSLSSREERSKKRSRH